MRARKALTGVSALAIAALISTVPAGPRAQQPPAQPQAAATPSVQIDGATISAGS
jgi:hypothetical protein